jgi:replication-associated recombination protein RarA
MSFIKKYPPQSVHDLVFADPKVAAEIGHYAAGKKTEHLLLYGPTGTGKSIAAQMIVDSCLPDLKGSLNTAPFQAASPFDDEFEQIQGNRGWQRVDGAKQLYVIIDEVDHLKTNDRMKLRHLINNVWNNTTLICTTNNLHHLELPFINRFIALEVKDPTFAQWQPRFNAILAAEGYTAPSTLPPGMKPGTTLNARALGRLIENILLALPAPQPQ